MAFTGRTPESLIPRSDSRNPATTCKGITKSGRPCRRAIDAKDTSHNGGVLAVSVVSDEDEEETGAAAFYCWQHKDQAEHLMAANPPGSSAQDTQLYPLQERNSIDTLVARLGVLDVAEEEEQSPAPHRRRKSRQDNAPGKPPRRINRPPTWNQVHGPLLSVPSDVMAERRKRPGYRPEPRPQRRKRGFWATLCCGAADDDTAYVKPSRPSNAPPPMAEAPRPSTSKPRPQPTTPPRKPLTPKTNTPSPDPANPLSYIPDATPPQTASALLAELSKPISPKDEEGYIYIFWLTPQAAGPAPTRTASDLLVPPERPGRSRATSDVLRAYSVRRGNGIQSDRSVPQDEADDPRTILLKIGRANNVTRRMHEWTRQCGYDLSLVRYYPYIPSHSATPSPTPSPSASPANSRLPSAQDVHAKVQFVHRVERLIHIELASKRVLKKCEACGKEHREWFEVEATREGVRGVDEVVRRWVGWGEGVRREE